MVNLNFCLVWLCNSFITVLRPAETLSSTPLLSHWFLVVCLVSNVHWVPPSLSLLCCVVMMFLNTYLHLLLIHLSCWDCVCALEKKITRRLRLELTAFRKTTNRVLAPCETQNCDSYCLSAWKTKLQVNFIANWSVIHCLSMPIMTHKACYACYQKLWFAVKWWAVDVCICSIIHVQLRFAHVVTLTFMFMNSKLKQQHFRFWAISTKSTNKALWGKTLNASFANVAPFKDNESQEKSKTSKLLHCENNSVILSWWENLWPNRYLRVLTWLFILGMSHPQ